MGRRGKSVSVAMAATVDNPAVRVINNQTMIGQKGGLSARKHSLQPLIKTKPRLDMAGNAKINSRGILSPYRDKPSVADKIMQRTRSKFSSVGMT